MSKKDRDIAKKLIDEADSFIVVTRLKKPADKVIQDEQIEDEDSPKGAKGKVKHKAYTLVSPNDSVEMLEYLFSRLPEIPKAVIELRKDEMKERGIWVPKE